MTDEQREPTKQEMKGEIASIDRSITDLLFYGGGQKILINGDDVLRSRGRGKGVAIYADLERDAHVASVIGKRKRAVTEREWGVNPASEDAQDARCAELVKNALTRLRFDKLTKSLLDAVLKGYSVAELMWEVVDGQSIGMDSGQWLVPRKFKKRNQRRFVFDIDGRPRLLTKEKAIEGEELPDRKFIVHTYSEDEEATPYGRGIGHAIFWPVFFKRQNISFWLVFNDKFGSPTAQGTYPPGTLDTEQKKLLHTLRRISQDAAIVVPEGFEVTLLEAAKSAAGDGYERMCHYMDAEISKAVLGETQTTTVGNSGGNRALGDVHNEVRLELAKDDADDLSYTLNETIVKWITELNFPGRTPPTVWRNFDEPEDLDTIAERDKKLRELGWERDEESFTETYGTGYVKVASAPPAEPGTARPGDPEFAEPARGVYARLRGAVMRVLGFAEPHDPAAAQRERNRVDQDTIAEGAVQLAEQWQELLGSRVNELQTLLDETGDLSLFRERLNEMANAEPSDEVVETIARATFASRLAGRLPRNKGRGE